jgi:hypothetical protein
MTDRLEQLRNEEKNLFSQIETILDSKIEFPLLLNYCYYGYFRCLPEGSYTLDKFTFTVIPKSEGIEYTIGIINPSNPIDYLCILHMFWAKNTRHTYFTKYKSGKWDKYLDVTKNEIRNLQLQHLRYNLNVVQKEISDICELERQVKKKFEMFFD